MIIDKTKPEPEPEPGTAYAFPPINVVVPDQQKQQLYQAIMTLITVVLSIALTLTAQVISQAVDTNARARARHQAADPLQTLGTSHFLDLAVTGDLASTSALTSQPEETPPSLATCLLTLSLALLLSSTRHAVLTQSPPSLSPECSPTSSSCTTRTKVPTADHPTCPREHFLLLLRVPTLGRLQSRGRRTPHLASDALRGLRRPLA